MQRFLLFTFLLLIPTLGNAQVPTFTSSNFTCEEVEIDGFCLGQPVFNGREVNQKRCKKKARRLASRTRRERRQNVRRNDGGRFEELTTLLQGYRVAGRSECAACWNYEADTCTGESEGGNEGEEQSPGSETGGGAGGSGGGSGGCVTTTPTIAQACDITANPSGPNISSISLFVANGETCSDASSSPVVALTYFGQAFCSGTLISSDTVLTAAHCFEDSSTNGLRVQFQDGSSIKIASFKQNPTWPGGDANRGDIAVVKLASAVTKITPASLHLSGGLSSGASVVIAGYGVSEVDATGTLKATVNTIDSVETVRINTSYKVGQAEGSSCVGDSGGPLFACVDDEWKLIGTTSTGGPSECAVNGAASSDEAQFANLSGGTNPSFLSENL